jgi:signal transduction histidine kinase
MVTISPAHFKIQKRIGWLIFSGMIVFALLNLERLLESSPKTIQAGTGLEEHVFNAIVLVSFGLIMLIFSRIDHPVLRMLQVAAFMALGVLASATNKPWDPTSMVLFVYAIVLSIQYSFFERRFVLKTVIALVFIFGVGVVRTMMSGKIDLMGSFTAVMEAVVLLLLLWIAFAEVIKEYIEKAKALELERRKDSVFVKFGQNVAGLVHNLSNMLSVLYSLNALMSQRAKTTDISDLISRQQAAFDRMTKTVERILAVVRAKQDTAVGAVELNSLLAGIIDYFRNDADFNEGVHVDMKTCEGTLYVEAQPLELCEVVENLIKNSWESMKGRSGIGENVIEIASFHAPVKGFSVRDTGCGIPGLSRCQDDECRKHFQIGHTVKEKGTGLGMPFVIEAVRSNGWSIRIESKEDQGTLTTILFDGSRLTV